MRNISAIFILFLILISCNNYRHGEDCYIHKGKFQATIVETGELQAVNSRVVVMPWLGWKYGRPKIATLIDEGTKVKAGDIVARVETSGIFKFLREKENALLIAKTDLRKLKIDHQNQLKQAEGKIISAEALYKLEKIQAQKIKFESQKQKEISKLRLRKAEISLQKVEQNLQTIKARQEYELKIQNLKIYKLQNEINNAHRALKKSRLLAPINGLVEYKRNRRTKEKVRAGDQLWPGAPILGIPDLSKMKVKTAVNETDIRKIKIGQRAIIRLDAFPKIPFPGKIIEIAKLCHKKDRESQIKLFDVIVLLEKSDIILKPGMTVSCEIYYAELEDVLYVSNKCISRENSRYYIFIKENSKIRKQEVKIGPRNRDYTVIIGDFKEGQRLKKQS